MKKKILTILLLCFSLSLCLFTLSACGHEHSYVTQVTAPTCTEQGYTSHICECGETKKGTFVNALGHDYSPTYLWNNQQCIALATCGRDSSHSEIETVTAIYIKDTDVSCDMAETGHYQATFTKTIFETQATANNSVVVGVALGHNYGEVIYVWENDKCTATKVCDTDNTHVETEEITATYVKDTDATCMTAETGHYVAMFTNNAFETQTTASNSVVSGEPNGHEYTSVVTSPTCMEQGYTMYTCHCTHSYVDDYVDALSHSFTNYVSDGNATTEADGTKTARCNNSGCKAIDTVTDVGSKLLSGYSLGLNYTTYRNGYAVSGIGSCSDTTIIIPSEYNGLPVIAIAEKAFYDNKNICEIIIPDSVLIIEKYAFSIMRNLRSVDLGNGVKEIDMSFMSCDALTTIKIPASVETINNLAFYLSDNLESIVVGESNNFYSSQDGILYNKAKTELICCPVNNSTKNITLPSTLITIGSYSFVDCKNLETITMSNNVTTIEGSAFSGCVKLKNIVMSNNITKIDNWAFENCKSLKSCVVPNGITTLYSYIFQNCTNLEWVYLSKNISHIAYDPFDGCNNLKTIYFGGTSEEWDEITYSSTTPSYLGVNFVFEHDMSCNHEIVIDDAVSSTCTETGLTEGSHCSICGTIIVKQEEVATIDHTEEIIQEVLPTCSSIGYTQGTRCSMCKTILISPTEIPMSMHTEETIPAIEATCYSFGYTEGKKCTVCKKVTIEPQLIAFSNHIAEEVQAIEATCSSSGTTAGKKCSVCKAILEGCVYISPIAHDYQTITSNDDGTHIKTCAMNSNHTLIEKCSYVYISNNNGTKTGTCECGQTISAIDETILIVKNNVLTGLTDYGNTLEQIIIPNGITKINDNVFEYCLNLTNVVIPNSVTHIGSSAFYACSKLNKLILPDSVVSIGDWAFAFCYNLVGVEFGAKISTIGENAFYSCSKVVEIVNNSSLSVENYFSSNPNVIDSFEQSKVITNDNFILYSNPTENDYRLLGYAGNEVSISLPNNISGKNYNIADYAFYNCLFEEVIIPDGVLLIGENAFDYCLELKTITIGNDVSVIGSRAFINCDKLSTIYLGNSLTSFGEYVFHDCFSLAEIIVSENNNAFSSVAGVLYSKDKTELVLYPCGKTNTTFEIPNSVVEIKEYAFACSKLEEIILHDSISSIERYAFEHCENLKIIELPVSLSKLSEGMFFGCRNIEEIIIHENITKIEVGVFGCCFNLNKLTFKGTVNKWNSIIKEDYWDVDLDFNTITCIDGVARI